MNLNNQITYSKSIPTHIPGWSSCHPKSYNQFSPNYHISDSEQSILKKPFSSLEILNALKSFEPYKAPGSDGYHPFFFQKYLHTTLPAIKTNCYRKSLIMRLFPHIWIKLSFVLSPKPIARKLLINSNQLFYATEWTIILTKIIVTRLRPILNNMIDPLQSSFLPHRRELLTIL